MVCHRNQRMRLLQGTIWPAIWGIWAAPNLHACQHHRALQIFHLRVDIYPPTPSKGGICITYSVLGKSLPQSISSSTKWHRRFFYFWSWMLKITHPGIDWFGSISEFGIIICMLGSWVGLHRRVAGKTCMSIFAASDAVSKDCCILGSLHLHDSLLLLVQACTFASIAEPCTQTTSREEQCGFLSVQCGVHGFQQLEIRSLIDIASRGWSRTDQWRDQSRAFSVWTGCQARKPSFSDFFPRDVEAVVQVMLCTSMWYCNSWLCLE